MKNTIFLLLPILVLSPIFTIHAQSKAKMNEVLQILESSDFTKSFLEVKKIMESEVRAFKNNQSQFSAADVQDVQKSYEDTKIRLDHILDDLQSDFATKKYRKHLRNSPDAFLQTKLVSDFELAINEYNNQCKKKIDFLLHVDNGGFDIISILAFWGLFDKTMDIIDRNKESKAEEAKNYFEQYYARSKRLKSWEAL